mgnify:CR=1 FL=1
MENQDIRNRAIIVFTLFGTLTIINFWYLFTRIIKLTENDLVVEDSFFKAQMSTVLMIDISHSMILYGEDRITPAKKVAMALAELITTRYPKDTIDILVFGNDAWTIAIKDLPYLKVGPYHTNTVAGLELAMDILRRRKNPNKQIFMITDGKPTCLKIGKRYYENSFDILNKISTNTIKGDYIKLQNNSSRMTLLQLH